MVAIETTPPGKRHAASMRPTHRWMRPFSETHHTIQTLNVHRQQGLAIPDFNINRDRYIILADVHRGEGDPVLDDFTHNEATYSAALRYYLNEDFRLVLNGDIEECWKANLDNIINRYAESAYALEREFVKKGHNYYLRTFGNHDDDWADEDTVRRYLHPILGNTVRVYPSITLGDKITIAHGHQGDLTSDRLSSLSRRFVRDVWRPAQEQFGVTQDLKRAQNNPIKTPRDRNLRSWARRHRHLLIAGHTHRALFHPTADAYRHYINVGACVHTDGLTGIELDRGEIRLIHWHHGDVNTAPYRTVVQSGDLGAVLARL